MSGGSSATAAAWASPSPCCPGGGASSASPTAPPSASALSPSCTTFPAPRNHSLPPWRGVKLGIAYGPAVCLGLVAILYYFPVAQQHFFALTPPTAAGGMAGHWVYGAVLGWLSGRWLPPGGKRRRRTSRAPPDPADPREPRSATVLVAVPDPVAGHGAVAAGPELSMPGGRLSSDDLYAVRCALEPPPLAHR